MRINNLTDFEVLVAIADTGSLTAAGRECGLTTPGVSAALRRLETALGVRLFVRTTRRVTPTPEGERLAQAARSAFEKISIGQAEISGHSSDEQGLIRVSLAAQMAHAMVPWFGNFAARHPKVKIELISADRVFDLVADRIDVALRYGPLSDSSFAAKLLAPARRIACASPGYLKRHGAPIEPADLVKHACIVHIVRNAPLDNWQFTDVNDKHAKPMSVKVKRGLVCAHGSSACQFALQGYGITYNSELALGRLVESGALVRLFPHHLGSEVPLFAVMPTRRLVPGRVRLLVDSLAAEFSGST